MPSGRYRLGVSGNPKGRPRKVPLRQFVIVDPLLGARFDELTMRVQDLDSTPDERAEALQLLRDLTDRIRPNGQAELDGDGRNYAKMTDADLMHIIASGSLAAHEGAAAMQAELDAEQAAATAAMVDAENLRGLEED